MKYLKSLYIQVILGIVFGIALGIVYPDVGTQMKPLGDAFIKLIKMVLAPVIFCTVVSGIAKMGDIKKIGRVGFKALIYFEIMTTIALAAGLFVGMVFQPGAGMHIDPASISAAEVADLTSKVAKGAQTTTQFLMGIIPHTVVDAFAKGDMLQVLFFACIFGFALSHVGEKGKEVLRLIDKVGHVLFVIIGYVMRVAPIGAFGAMSFTIGKYGIASLSQLGMMIACVYGVCALYILVAFGAVAKLCKFNLFHFLWYIKEEILIVLGGASSEPAMPRLMSKLENAGVAKGVVGLVVPTGYSFNLDGTCLYLCMGALFIAQAFDIELTWSQRMTILLVSLLTSKGAAGVVGSAFMTLTATIASMDILPIAGMALLLGIDRFLAEVRSVTNFIGNGIAAVAVGKWENAVDMDQFNRVIAGGDPMESDSPEEVLIHHEEEEEEKAGAY